MKSIRLALFFIILMALAACDQNFGGSTATDPVLAKVGDSSIRQSQLNVMMDRLSPEIREQKNVQLEITILQGIVRTKALASITEQQLNEDERELLDAKVQVYRDELLAKSYIQKNIVPQPVTAEMVNQYYLAHQNEYTTPGKVGFEYMVTTSKNIDDDSLNKVVAAFSKAKNIKNWKLYSKTLKEKNLPVEYKSAFLAPESINKELRAHVDKLQMGNVSDLIYGDYIYVAKVIKRAPDVVKPVYEVSISIRKKLAPQKLRQVLTQHIDKALKSMDVEYIK